MFKNEKDPVTPSAQETETVIAPSVRVEGDFVSQGNVRIEGAVSGSISTEKDLFVGEGAKITANVSARNATISGEQHGNLRIAERLELTSTARVYGDIQAKVLTVSPGAAMKGQLVIGSEANVAEAAALTAARSAQTAREKKIEEVLTPAR
jgi:cytoskeletal protein CcmA (bactofilin family)